MGTRPGLWHTGGVQAHRVESDPMRVPQEVYQLQSRLAAVFPRLSPAQQGGLAWWVYGTILAHSACQNAVITALLSWGRVSALGQRLREWLYDGQDKAAPCHSEVVVERCFAPLLAWVLKLWQGQELALAIDATLQSDRVVALVVSVLYRGSAMPVAWVILPANQPGPWLGPICRLLRQLRPAVPPPMTVLVLADRGLWSPRLWKRIRDLGWHPLLRVRRDRRFTPVGAALSRADQLVKPGQGWVGRGWLSATRRAPRLKVTLIAVWEAEQAKPWVVLSDLPPAQVGVRWYALRMWIELGFAALKGVGWQWQRTRRTDPNRVARHWLVLAVATVWVLAYGTRAEQAAQRNTPAAYLRTPPVALPPAPAPAPRRRLIRLFQRGLQALTRTLSRGRLWQRLWLVPEPWPDPPPGLVITIQDTS